MDDRSSLPANLCPSGGLLYTRLAVQDRLRKIQRYDCFTGTIIKIQFHTRKGLVKKERVDLGKSKYMQHDCTTLYLNSAVPLLPS